MLRSVLILIVLIKALGATDEAAQFPRDVIFCTGRHRERGRPRPGRRKGRLRHSGAGKVLPVGEAQAQALKVPETERLEVLFRVSPHQVRLNLLAVLREILGDPPAREMERF